MLNIRGISRILRQGDSDDERPSLRSKSRGLVGFWVQSSQKSETTVKNETEKTAENLNNEMFMCFITAFCL